MESELRGHLDGALADAKGVDDVIGPDIERFAEEWAAPQPAGTLGLAALMTAGIVVLS